MISGIFHDGSGLGNQLFRYVMTRVLAADLGVDFGMIGNFKGDSFMNIDKGVPVHDLLYEFNETKVVVDGVDVRGYDCGVKDVKDFTLIDGEFQGEKYFEHRLKDIKEWLTVAQLEVPGCILSHRGGEYKGVRDLYLPQEYWNRAIELMKERVPGITFRVVTDDPEEANKMFPGLPISHEIGHDWRSIRYAKYLILSNSSFGILPALLGDAEIIYAPKFWARRNTGVQALAYNVYSRFTHI